MLKDLGSLEAVKIYTSMTGTEYDVEDFSEVVQKYSGELPPIFLNDRIYYSTIQKQAVYKGYKIVWISRSIDNEVIINTLVDKLTIGIVGFGVAPKGKEEELNKALKIAKSKIESATDDDRQKALEKVYLNKANKYKMI